MMRAAASTQRTQFVEQFARDVAVGLATPRQKTLPSQYLYDAVGSALFDVICLLPEYGLSRAGESLLAQHGAALAERVGGVPLQVVELGSGSGKKTRHLLNDLVERQHGTSLRYFPIDISGAALTACSHELAGLQGLRVTPIEASYLEGLARASAERVAGERLLVLFLGSTIGNFDRQTADAFLTQVRQLMRPGDSFLLAADLVKPVDTLILAYDDPAGVTAAFNRNMLAHINQVLQADFVLANFAHEARYNVPAQRVEMHLRALCDHTVRIGRANVSVAMREGETIWTESSHKFTLANLRDMATQAGFSYETHWVESAWHFAHSLLRVV